MALTDSSSGKILRDYSIHELKYSANLMRGYDLVALHAAGSGHAGGTLSIMDITAALYLKIANHDPQNPNWPDRDRIIWSTGHKAPSLYLGLAFAGFCPIDDVVTLRKLGSPFQGHPHWLKLPGVEVSTGSHGQGLSIAVGMALAARIDSHDMEQIVDALEQARAVRGRPVAVLADTAKGKGVSFMEDQAGWHGKVPNHEELMKGLAELRLKDRIPVAALLQKSKAYQEQVDCKLAAKMPKFVHDYWWNLGDRMKVKMEPTRRGFGQSLAANGDDERLVCLGLDISNSITISDFYAGKPERKKRWISMGIAEQSATSAAAGLAREGKLPVLGSYATFAASRNLDQIRTSVCYGNFNVMIAG